MEEWLSYFKTSVRCNTSGFGQKKKKHTSGKSEDFHLKTGCKSRSPFINPQCVTLCNAGLVIVKQECFAALCHNSTVIIRLYMYLQ
jgi:hypothetical protein